MIAKFNITTEDVLELYKNMLLTARFFKRIISFGRWFFAISLFIVMILWTFQHTLINYERLISIYEILIIIAITVFIYYFLPHFVRWFTLLTYKILLKKNKPFGILGEQTITITENGLERVTETRKDFFEWSKINKLIGVEHYFFLYLSDI
ncbi:hypothetical protein [Gracilibacillus suaedae]|uniref:hypothetical protein n=1 Tax=Gracilibacillus suaedae TaxID=2820273 RepID=UPI001ABEA4EA|nr:hypothetical protein [Gracilibacillus suaedae]